MGQISEFVGRRFSFFKYFCYLCGPALIRAGIKSPKGGIYYMLIIDSKDCENIDKALKKYKKKFEKSKILLQLRDRQAFTKPSVRRRKEVLKAIYKDQVTAGKFD
jgi:small subunit ribosomal protein S21